MVRAEALLRKQHIMLLLLCQPLFGLLSIQRGG